MLRRADSQVTTTKRRVATLTSSSRDSLLMVAFFSIEFDLKSIPMKEKADLYRLREVIFTHTHIKKKKDYHGTTCFVTQ